jgi:hypothetical protein
VDHGCIRTPPKSTVFELLPNTDIGALVANSHIVRTGDLHAQRSEFTLPAFHVAVGRRWK